MTSLNSGTVYLIEDHAEVRRALCALLEPLAVEVQSFDEARPFLDSLPSRGPSCVLCDVCLPGMDGLEVQAELATRDPGLPIILVTGHAEVDMAVKAMRSGAYDFLEKPVRRADLLTCVEGAIDLHRGTIAAAAERRSIEERYAMLTDRERQVAERAAQGLLNTEIAREFGVSSQAIDAHRKRALRKLGVSNVVELARLTARLEPRRALPQAARA